MRIAYVVDIHDAFDAVPRALAAIGAVDLLLIGGDITTGGSPDDVQHAIDLWRPLVPGILAVSGNMDSPAIDRRLDELGIALDSRGVVIGDVGLFGLSGAPISPLGTPYEIDETEILRRMELGHNDVAHCRFRIFCPHAPPHGTACDRLASGHHVGSPVIRRFVERTAPDLLLCGHIHEARATDSIGPTLVVNPGPARAGHYAVIEVRDVVSVELDG